MLFMGMPLVDCFNYFVDITVVVLVIDEDLYV